MTMPNFLILKDKVLGTYGVQPLTVTFLPNIIDPELGEVIKSEKPTVVFLAEAFN